MFSIIVPMLSLFIPICIFHLSFGPLLLGYYCAQQLFEDLKSKFWSDFVRFRVWLVRIDKNFKAQLVFLIESIAVSMTQVSCARPEPA